MDSKLSIFILFVCLLLISCSSSNDHEKLIYLPDFIAGDINGNEITSEDLSQGLSIVVLAKDLKEYDIHIQYIDEYLAVSKTQCSKVIVCEKNEIVLEDWVTITSAELLKKFAVAVPKFDILIFNDKILRTVENSQRVSNRKFTYLLRYALDQDLALEESIRSSAPAEYIKNQESILTFLPSAETTYKLIFVLNQVKMNCADQNILHFINKLDQLKFNRIIVLDDTFSVQDLEPMKHNFDLQIPVILADSTLIDELISFRISNYGYGTNLLYVYDSNDLLVETYLLLNNCDTLNTVLSLE